MKSTFIIIALLSSFFISSAHAMTIVKDHQPRAAIVVDANASARIKSATKILQEYIEKSTGAVLPIRNTPGSAININVGETAYTKAHHLNPGNLDQDGFIMQGDDAHNFAIIGGSDRGVEFGVYDFLERYLGVRWLAGGELFTDIPKHATINISSEKIREEPVFLSRQLGPIGFDWAQYNPDRIESQPMVQSVYKSYNTWGKFNRVYRRTRFHHNLYKIFPASEFVKTHPEYYPLIHGKHYLPKSDRDSNWQLNFSAPGVVDAAVQQIEKYFSSHPDASSISVGMNDSQRFDESQETLIRRKKLGGVANEYATWVNDVAAKVLLEYPNKTFGLLAYSKLRTPPSNVKFNPHVVPYITYELSRWYDPESRKVAQDLALQWQDHAAQIGWYDYFYGAFYQVPRSYLHAEADALRWLSDHGVKHYYAEDYPNFGEGPKDWVQTKLLWDPHQDVDVLINDWCTHAVGAKAAPSLEAYYALWEKFWTQDLPKTPWYNSRSDYLAFAITDYLLYVPQSYLDKSDELLARTIQLADTPIHKKRAQKLQQMWQFYKASVIARKGDEYWKTADLQTESDAHALLEKCTEAITQAQHRLEILSDMRMDPLYGYVAFRITSKADLFGNGWGASSLWSLEPWVNKSSKVRAGLEKIAHMPQKPMWRRNGTVKDIPMHGAGVEIATRVLAAANGDAQQILKNFSFESGTKNWNVSEFVASKNIGQNSASCIMSNGATTAQAVQKVAYVPGDYYVRFTTFSSKETPAKVKVSLRAVNQHGRQRGRNLPSGTSAVLSGKWSTFVIPATLIDMHLTDTMSLEVTVNVEGANSGDQIYIDDIGVYRVKSD